LLYGSLPEIPIRGREWRRSWGQGEGLIRVDSVADGETPGLIGAERLSHD
jgi:hypothetical protein